jgi:hypothetical protein
MADTPKLEDAAPWVAASADRGRWQVLRVHAGGGVETLCDCRGRQRLFRTNNKAWEKAEQLNTDYGLTFRQIEVLIAAYRSSDGWIECRTSRIWGIAPMAVMACERKGYLAMPRGRGRARLTKAGRALIEQLTATKGEAFGLARRETCPPAP